MSHKAIYRESLAYSSSGSEDQPSGTRDAFSNECSSIASHDGVGLGEMFKEDSVSSANEILASVSWITEMLLPSECKHGKIVRLLYFFPTTDLSSIKI